MEELAEDTVLVVSNLQAGDIQAGDNQAGDNHYHKVEAVDKRQGIRRMVGDRGGSCHHSLEEHWGVT